MHRRALDYVQRCFQSGLDPSATLKDMLESGQMSEQAVRDIGAKYLEAGPNASLIEVLTGVFALLQEHSVEAPPSFLLVFQGQKGGDQWLDNFLKYCSLLAEQVEKAEQAPTQPAAEPAPAQEGTT
jgi:hypothetical protein